jgi:hypothetical protein
MKKRQPDFASATDGFPRVLKTTEIFLSAFFSNQNGFNCFAMKTAQSQL